MIITVYVVIKAHTSIKAHPLFSGWFTELFSRWFKELFTHSAQIAGAKNHGHPCMRLIHDIRNIVVEILVILLSSSSLVKATHTHTLVKIQFLGNFLSTKETLCELHMSGVSQHISRDCVKKCLILIIISYISMLSKLINNPKFSLTSLHKVVLLNECDGN